MIVLRKMIAPYVPEDCINDELRFDWSILNVHPFENLGFGIQLQNLGFVIEIRDWDLILKIWDLGLGFRIGFKNLGSGIGIWD